MTNLETAEYGLVGFPLGHSFSKDFFNQKFINENINAKYINFELSNISSLMETIKRHPNLRGLNITIPYKEQILPYLDEIDNNAKEIGAVNVIKLTQVDENKPLLKGYNSDVIGFMDSIKPLLQSSDTHALILGTGGAAKAIEYGLKKLGLSSTYVSRTKKEGNITYSDIDKYILEQYTVIVNTTPLGMYPQINNCPNIPYHLLNSSHLCYDLIYNPDETLFMKNAKEQGSRIKNGLEMLILQASAAWEIWTE